MEDPLSHRFGLAAESCLFIDDAEANVAAARGLGMQTIRYQGSDDLRDRLRTMNLL